MPVPQLYDFVILSLAGYFIINQLFRKEAASKTQLNQPRTKSDKINPYFLLTLCVCVFGLTAIELLVPYGNIAVLALAVCGFCSILMELMFYVLTNLVKSQCILKYHSEQESKLETEKRIEQGIKNEQERMQEQMRSKEQGKQSDLSGLSAQRKDTDSIDPLRQFY